MFLQLWLGWKPLLLSPSCERFGLGRRDSCWACSRFTQISVFGLSIFSLASVFCLSAILGLLWGCSLGFFLPLGAGFLLDQVLGRFTPRKTCLAASNCWRSRRFTWPGSPWRCSSSPTPADQEAQRQLGGSKDLGAFPSNSKFCRVLCVSWCPWSLCGAGCVVFFSFSRGLDVILRG